tara:strand:+ start:203 stop:394 length:192 start_codon:yes stop_codon:yes gene_type:complete
MIKFHLNKAYKYVTNTHPIHIFFDTMAGVLGVMAFGGIFFMIFAMLTGQIDFNNINIPCEICD